jgi:hypothetical protein
MRRCSFQDSWAGDGAPARDCGPDPVSFGILLVSAAGALPSQRQHLDRSRRQAEERTLALLRSWLTPEQIEQFNSNEEFYVVGRDPGTRYRITARTQLNVIQLDEDDRYVARLSCQSSQRCAQDQRPALVRSSAYVMVLYTLSKSARHAILNGRSRSESGFPDNSTMASFSRSKLGLSEISMSPLITDSALSITIGGAKRRIRLASPTRCCSSPFSFIPSCT